MSIYLPVITESCALVRLAKKALLNGTKLNYIYIRKTIFYHLHKRQKGMRPVASFLSHLFSIFHELLPPRLNLAASQLSQLLPPPVWPPLTTCDCWSNDTPKGCFPYFIVGVMAFQKDAFLTSLIFGVTATLMRL